MANVQFVVLPHESVAVQVTSVLTLTGKMLPLGGLQLTVTGPQPPVAELLKKTGTPPEQLVALTVILDEQVSTIGGQRGGLTVMANVQLVVLPQESVAVQVTSVLTLTGKMLPLGGLQVTVVVPHPPVAELVKKTGTPPEQLVALTVILDEQVSTIGGQAPP